MTQSYSVIGSMQAVFVAVQQFRGKAQKHLRNLSKRGGA
jgi:hypothetical protein